MRRQRFSMLCQSTILRSVIALVLAAPAGVLAQGLRDVQTPDKPLILKAQGSFFVGGETVEETQVELGDLGPGGHIAVNQMYVRYMVPQNGDGVPVVMVHGATLTGKSWETTPDGRMGWDEYFVRKGHPVYVPDQVGRGRSGFNQAVFNNARAGSVAGTTLPRWIRFSDEVVWPNFRFGAKPGAPYADSQFPLNAIDELAKQGVPDVSFGGVPNPNPTFKALADLAGQVNGAVLMGHSQSGAFPLAAALLNPTAAKGLVLVEPGGCPGQQYTDEQIKTLATIPVLAVFGDHRDTPTGIGIRPSWQLSFESCQALITRLNAAGGQAQMLSPAETGFHGNSHMIMQDKNNQQIADLILKWIDERVGKGQSIAGARPAAPADGKGVYDANCANCHGPRAQGAVKAGIEISILAERGGKQPPDLTDAAWDHGSTDDEIFTVIKKGIPAGMMAPYEGRLSDIEIRNVVAYLRSLSLPQGGPPAAPPAAQAAPALQAPERTLDVADYAELPVTGVSVPNRGAAQLARGSILRDEPGGRRFFVNDLNGPLYILDKQTKQFTPYLNFDGTGDHPGLFPKFTAAAGFASGIMNFVFDPDYARNGIFYTLHMENPNSPGESAAPKAGVVPGLNLEGYTTTTPLSTPIIPNAMAVREMVIVEWTDRQIGNTTFEGTAREVFRLQMPGGIHPLNEIIFNPAARPGDPDWRVMYLGVGDSQTGERPGPMRLHAQRLDTLHGKILRIIPMLSEHTSTSTVSANGRYRIPNDNPFVSVEGARKEIWALGLRNPHRLTWYVDPARPREATLLAFNIGLVSWETVMIIKKGANYGYPLREGTQSMSATNGMGPIPGDDMIPVQLSDTVTRGTVKPTYAVAAYPHTAAAGGDAIANGFVYRGKRIPALQGTLVFGDITTGRIWYAQMKEVLAADDGNPLTLAPLHELGAGLRALSEAAFKRRGGQGDSLPGFGAVAGRGRVDIRLSEDNDGELYVLTKGDGMIREFRSVR